MVEQIGAVAGMNDRRDPYGAQPARHLAADAIIAAIVVADADDQHRIARRQPAARRPLPYSRTTFSFRKWVEQEMHGS